MAQTFDTILRDLKNKVYAPVYLLQGEEPYYIDQISDYLEKNVLDEMEKEFNQTIVYGKDTDALTLVSAAKRYPMMSNYQLIIVKEAQDLKALNKKDSANDELNPIEVYLQNPVPSTILVFCFKYKKIDGRSKLAKLFDTKAVVFESIKLKESAIPAWVKNYCTQNHYKIQDQANNLIAEYLGNDLSKVSNALDKLMINIPNSETINTTHIETYIGISKEYNVFELNNALARKDVLKANKIIQYFGANTKANPLVLVLANLYSFFYKVIGMHAIPNRKDAGVALGINFYFVGEYETAARNYSLPKLVSIIACLRDTDLKSKGLGNTSAQTDAHLLKELIYKILH
ncbi:MAG: DNA polymerase III subunit delta [Bacteroidia bacterium]|nr:DNA polymerase III subunit delta [Bacteroidia bacterium]